MGKRRSSDYILVSVSVHPVLRDYIVSTNGSDLLVPDDRGPLWVAVKSHLRQCPADYKPMTAAPVPGEIRIVLPPISASKPILNVNIDEVIRTNFLSRNYLDRKGQRVVADLLMKTFKDRYRAFMTGYLASHPNQSGRDSQIKDGIDEFCRIHRITMDDKITYEMLRKDWYRFRSRESSSDFCDEVKENI